MIANKVSLSSFQNKEFRRGASVFKEFLWMLLSALFFRHSLAILNGVKIYILKIFGAQIGRGVSIKPNVHIKFPWKLNVGDYCWIGEHVWIDNLENVFIEGHVCISQGAMLLCGNHDYTSSSFRLISKEIHIMSGAWVGAKAIVCPGVVVGSHAVLTVGSIASKSMDSYGVYQGNPAIKVNERVIS